MNLQNEKKGKTEKLHCENVTKLNEMKLNVAMHNCMCAWMGVCVCVCCLFCI